MVSIKKLVYALVVMAFAVVAFSSCDKSDLEIVTRESDSMLPILDSLQSEGLVSPLVSRQPFGVTVLQTRFLPLYHWWEWRDRNDRKGVCAETSYMVAIKAVAAWNNISYTMSLEQQNKIVNGTVDSPNPYQLYNYWQKNNKKFATCDFARGAKLSPDGQNWTTRTKIKEFIETALREKKLVILPVKINGHRAYSWNNDSTVSWTNASDESNNYISKYGNVGHWIVIYRLDVEKNSEGFSIGTAYYCDVLESNAASSMKSVNYLRLLDANLAAGSTYSAMWFDSPSKWRFEMF